MKILLVVSVLFSLLLSSYSTLAMPMYSITDLGTLGRNHSIARDVNDKGEVTGLFADVVLFDQHAFKYDSNGMHDLGTLGGHTSNRSCNQ